MLGISTWLLETSNNINLWLLIQNAVGNKSIRSNCSVRCQVLIYPPISSLLKSPVSLLFVCCGYPFLPRGTDRVTSSCVALMGVSRAASVIPSLQAVLNCLLLLILWSRLAAARLMLIGHSHLHWRLLHVTWRSSALDFTRESSWSPITSHHHHSYHYRWHLIDVGLVSLTLCFVLFDPTTVTLLFFLSLPYHSLRFVHALTPEWHAQKQRNLTLRTNLRTMSTPSSSPKWATSKISSATSLSGPSWEWPFHSQTPGSACPLQWSPASTPVDPCS